MKRLAIDINHNPMFDTAEKMTEAEATKILNEIAVSEDKLATKIIKLYTPSAKKGLNRDERYDVLVGIIVANQSEIKDYFANLDLAMAIVFAKKQVDSSLTEKILKTLKFFETQPDRFLALTEDWVTEGKTLHTAKTLKDIWGKSKNKEQIVTIGKMRVHNVSENLASSQLELILEGIKQVGKIIENSKLPHFSSVLYGDVFITKSKEYPASYHFKGDYLSIGELAFRNIPYFIYVLLHELSHRYFFFVLNEKEKQGWGEYYKLEVNLPAPKKPHIGDSLFYDWGFSAMDAEPGNDIITSISKDPYGFEIYHYNHKVEGAFHIRVLSQARALPTTYSRADAEEFFCETNALYHLGKIRKSLKDSIEAIFEAKFILPFQKAPVVKSRTDLQVLSDDEVDDLESIAAYILDHSEASKSERTLASNFIDHLEESRHQHSKQKEWYIEKDIIQELNKAKHRLYELDY